MKYLFATLLMLFTGSARASDVVAGDTILVHADVCQTAEQMESILSTNATDGFEAAKAKYEELASKSQCDTLLMEATPVEQIAEFKNLPMSTGTEDAYIWRVHVTMMEKEGVVIPVDTDLFILAKQPLVPKGEGI